MRRYELMLLLRPDMEDERLQSAVEKVTRAIVNGGGALTKVSPWGKRRLAYRIANHREASYFLIHFDIEPSAIRDLERGFLISEEILRHMVTVLEERAATFDADEPPAGSAAVEPEAEPEAEPETTPIRSEIEEPPSADETAEAPGDEDRRPVTAGGTTA